MGGVGTIQRFFSKMHTIFSEYYLLINKLYVFLPTLNCCKLPM